MIKVVEESMPDVLHNNTKVIVEKLKRYAYDGFGQAAALSSNNKELQNLFKQLQAEDKKALDELAKLKDDDNQQLHVILCALFHEKIILIESFIAKQSKQD